MGQSEYQNIEDVGKGVVSWLSNEPGGDLIDQRARIVSLVDHMGWLNGHCSPFEEESYETPLLFIKLAATCHPMWLAPLCEAISHPPRLADLDQWLIGAEIFLGEWIQASPDFVLPFCLEFQNDEGFRTLFLNALAFIAIDDPSVAEKSVPTVQKALEGTLLKEDYACLLNIISRLPIHQGRTFFVQIESRLKESQIVFNPEVESDYSEAQKRFEGS